MNKYLKKVTTLLFAFALTAGACFPVFANSDSDDAPDPTPGSAVVTRPSAEYQNDAAHVLTVDDTESWLSYVLAVSTGVAPGSNVDYIQIRYFSDDGTLITQVLDPKGMDHLGSESKLDYLTNDVMGLSGSRFATYAPILYWNNSTSLFHLYDEYAFNPSPVYGLYSSEKNGYTSDNYELWDDVVLGGSDSPSVSEKLADTDNMFASYTTEYIKFRTEFPVVSVYEVDFIMNGVGTQDWSLNGWRLFSTRDWKVRIPSGQRDPISSFVSDPEDTYETPEGKIICPSFPEYENFGFYSDRMAINFDGTLICESTEIPENGVGYQLGSENIRFVAVNGIPSNSTFKAFDPGAEYIPDNLFGLDNNVEMSRSLSPVTLNFSINIADEYASGIDLFNRTVSSKFKFDEMLRATIYYENSMGFTEHVTVPVFSSALAEFVAGDSFSNQNVPDPDRYKKLTSGDYLSFAQQGDSLCFSVEFPDFYRLESVSLDYHNTVDENDALTIKDITVYSDMSGRNRYHYYKSNSDIAVDLEIDKGELLYRSKRVDYNLTLDSASRNHTFEMEKGGTALPITDYTDRFLVSIDTDNVQSAGTTGEVIVQFDYINFSGKEVSTQEYKLSEACLEFYGYNPAENAEGKLEDASYYIGMKRGGTLRFFITAANCSRFTNVKFHMENSTDDWQLGALTIQSLAGGSVGKRVIYAEEGEYNGLQVNRRYDRIVNAESIYSSSEKKIYLNGDDTVEYDLDGAAISDDTPSRNYKDYYYSMDYETACSDLRLDEAAKNYEVRVNVAGNSTNGTVDDGCGSNNLFYFQLVFKNGVSGYVLANQQLEADGFRSGQQECFYVSSNEDFGDVVAVNIIPDDVTDDSSKLDKLCIDSIEIIKYNRGSVNKRYVCENVGWVNMEYRDKGSTDEEAGRSASEIMTTASVTSSAYMLTLEFAIAYDEPPKEKMTVADEFGNKEEIEVDGTQFVGNLIADISYVNSANETKTIRDVQLVKLMYDYDGKTAMTDEDRGYISDPSWMFRPKTIDRFTVSMDDATYIKSITLKGNPKHDCYLNIAGISVSILKSDGMLNINSNSEYQMSYDMEPAVLVSGVNRTLPEKFYFASNRYTNYPFTFLSNQIEELNADTSLDSIISRVPESVNDTLNIYLYMDDKSLMPSISGKSPVTSIYYSSVNTGNSYLTKTARYKETTVGGVPVLYATGLSATNMSLITNMTITADPDCINCLIDHAIVQQLRNGVVINTYKMTFTGSNPAVRLGISMASKTSAAIGSTQTLKLLMSEDTPASKLVSETYDIAAAILYKSAVGETDEIFTSPYVFLTDSGCHSIKGGTLAEFVFNEASVKEIVGVYVVGVNGLEGEVESAVIETVEQDENGGLISTGYYSINDSFDLVSAVSESSTRRVTSSGTDNFNSLMLATFRFTTMSGSKYVDSMGSDPIRMNVVYTNVDGYKSTKTIDDIRSYLRSGGFGPGETAEVSFFLEGVKKLNYIELEPYDLVESSLAAWNLDSISVTVSGGENQNSVSVDVDQIIRESGDGVSVPRINLSNVVARVTVRKNDGLGANRGTVDNGEIEFTGAYGDNFYITPNIMGTLDGSSYSYKVERVTSGKTEVVTRETVTSAASQSFAPEHNYSGDYQIYRITVASAENPAACSTVLIKVAAEQQSETGTGSKDQQGTESENGSAETGE